MSFIQAKPIATHDFYGAIHKGLRLALSQMLVRLGSADVSDEPALAVLLADLRRQCAISDGHLRHEDQEVHTALEARAPGASARLAQAHDHHRQAFEEIEFLTARLERAQAADRAALMKQLYLRFSLFVAEDFAHMAEEEQLILPVLQSLFTDEELLGIEDRIMSGIAPQEMALIGAMMIPAATRAERIGMMGAIRATAPAEAFEGLMEACARPTLSAEDFRHLSQGLGLAA